MKKVKIYGTLGPACSDTEILKQMFDEGMDGIRLNLSHTTLDASAALIDTYHKAACACGVRPELLIDMQGPELRIGELKEPILLAAGDAIAIDSIPFPKEVLAIVSDGTTGRQLLLDDGKLLIEVSDSAGCRMLRVLRGGMLRSRKSVALPGFHMHTPAMTDADREQVKKAKQYGVTGLMQPFVRGSSDLIEVRKALDESGCSDIRLFAKIENMEGVDKLEEIVPHCDEIVIARGDLGNAMDLWELPAVQKHIAEICCDKGRDFMVVTQMLDSMINRPVPTRAEVSDIFNAVLDGAVSVMVTGETAAGKHPAAAIRYLARTVLEAEAFLRR